MKNNNEERRGSHTNMKTQQHRQPKQPQSYTKTIPVKGMHCASCELLIADELEAIPEVESAYASLKTNSATVISTQSIPDTTIEAAIEAAGYEVGIETDKQPLLAHSQQIWKDIIIGVALIICLILIFNIFGIDKLLGIATNSSSTGTMALLVGLTAGFSTCMALIGGLVLSIASKYAEKHPTEPALQKFRPHLVFNLGRVISFIVFGAAIGTIGSAFSFKGPMLGVLMIVVGLVMLVLGLQLTEAFPRITKGLTLPSGLAKKLGIKQRGEREYSHKNAFLLGAMTFFLPCGFTQAMQLLAVSTGSPVQAAIIMGAFAVGTAPGLLSLGGLTSVVKGAFAQRFFRIVGVIVVAMAIINLSNGYTLTGFNRLLENIKLPTRSQTVSTQSAAGSVVLHTTYKLSGDITPRSFTTKVGQKTTLLVDVQDDGQGCMSTIMIPELDDTPQYLKKGERLELTFTPTRAGSYSITCAMGIVRGSITVTE